MGNACPWLAFPGVLRPRPAAFLACSPSLLPFALRRPREKHLSLMMSNGLIFIQIAMTFTKRFPFRFYLFILYTPSPPLCFPCPFCLLKYLKCAKMLIAQRTRFCFSSLSSFIFCLLFFWFLLSVQCPASLWGRGWWCLLFALIGLIGMLRVRFRGGWGQVSVKVMRALGDIH